MPDNTASNSNHKEKSDFEIGSKQIKDREQIISTASELGVKPGDAFVSDGILWVEGPSDIQIYRALLSKIGIDVEEKNISIMCGGGDTMQHTSIDALSRLNRNFAILLDSDKTDSGKQAAKWKKELIEGCNKMGGYGYITSRREIENYFSLRAVRQYYNSNKLPVITQYEDFAAYIKNNLTDRSYIKTRDGKEIVKLMNKQEVEACGDLYVALSEIQASILKWKKI